MPILKKRQDPGGSETRATLKKKKRDRIHAAHEIMRSKRQ